MIGPPPSVGAAAPEAGRRWVPGEAGIWVMVLGDMSLFALFFAAFVHQRMQQLELFRQSQQSLDQALGAFNTVLLLTSSWLVALAVQAARKGAMQALSRNLGLAMLCGAGFVTVKFFEYRDKVIAGLGLNSNDFFMYYFVLTGIHLLHVLIGIGALAFLRAHLRQRSPDSRSMSLLECGASYWHMVDVLWVFLFALLYLMD